MSRLDRIPWWILIAGALSLGLAPFVPEPHVWEKIRLLAHGELTRLIDMFDLAFHGAPWILASLKATRELRASS